MSGILTFLSSLAARWLHRGTRTNPNDFARLLLQRYQQKLAGRVPERP